MADKAASAPVAEATAQLESAGLEVPKAPAQAAPAAAAEKAPLADNEYDIIVVGGPCWLLFCHSCAQLGGKKKALLKIVILHFCAILNNTSKRSNDRNKVNRLYPR